MIIEKAKAWLNKYWPFFLKEWHHEIISDLHIDINNLTREKALLRKGKDIYKRHLSKALTDKEHLEYRLKNALKTVDTETVLKELLSRATISKAPSTKALCACDTGWKEGLIGVGPDETVYIDIHEDCMELLGIKND